MYERHKMSQREWPYNLWDAIVEDRKEMYLWDDHEKDCNHVQGYADDPYPPELYLPIVDAVLSDTLSESRQKVIRLRYEQGMTYAQIGEVLGFDRSRAHALTREALHKLAKTTPFFRLKAVPESEVIQLRREYKALSKEKDKCMERNAELEQQVAELRVKLGEKDIIQRIDQKAESAGVLQHKTDFREKRVVLSDPIEVLGLKHRCNISLIRARIVTVQDLVDHTEEELLRVRYMGVMGVAQIIEALDKYGYELKKEG